MNAMQSVMEAGDRVTADQIFAELEALAVADASSRSTGGKRASYEPRTLLLHADLVGAEASNDAVLELGLAHRDSLKRWASTARFCSTSASTKVAWTKWRRSSSRPLANVPQIDSLRPALASVWCQIGDFDRAREWTTATRASDFRELTRSMQWLAAMRHAANAAIALTTITKAPRNADGARPALPVANHLHQRDDRWLARSYARAARNVPRQLRRGAGLLRGKHAVSSIASTCR